MLCFILTGYVLAQFNREFPARGANAYHKVTLAAVLRARGYNAFYTSMLKEGLYSGLYGIGEYTLFVPINSNYQNQSNTKTIRNLKKNLGCYVFDRKFPSNLIRDGMSLTGVNHCTIFMNKVYDRFKKQVTLWIHGVKILEEIRTEHSIIYIISSSLQIPSLSLIEYLKQSGNHHVMYSLMKKQIIHFQFPFGATLFAPLDTAFAHLPGTYVKNIFSNDTEARVRTLFFFNNEILPYATFMYFRSFRHSYEVMSLRVQCAGNGCFLTKVGVDILTVLAVQSSYIKICTTHRRRTSMEQLY